ncbi:hypothetical protein [Glutamicibacter uratoxydans]
MPPEIVEPLKELAASSESSAPAAIQQRLLQACDDAGATNG